MANIQDVIREFYPAFLEKYRPSDVQAKAALHILNCKTVLQFAQSVGILLSTITPVVTVIAQCVRVLISWFGWTREIRMLSILLISMLYLLFPSNFMPLLDVTKNYSII